MVKILNLIFVSNLKRDQNEQKLNVEIKDYKVNTSIKMEIANK